MKKIDPIPQRKKISKTKTNEFDDFHQKEENREENNENFTNETNVSRRISILKWKDKIKFNNDEDKRTQLETIFDVKFDTTGKFLR